MNMKSIFKILALSVVLYFPCTLFSQTKGTALTIPDLSDVNVTADTMPSFPGGLDELSQYLNKNIKFPVEAMKKNETGKVIVRFVVEKNGKITRAHVIKSATLLLDKEALRVVNSMPNWIPGKIDGKNVAVTQVLPFTFNSLIDKEPVKFPGGVDSSRVFIERNLKYPEEALKNKIEGRVDVGLMVDKEGTITKTWIKNSDNTFLNDEALRLVNSIPKLIPATYKKEPIEMDAVFTIVFQLPENMQKFEDKIFEVVEVNPSFPGGDNGLMNYLSNSIQYPVVAQENNIHGRVTVQFVVWKDGSIRNVQVVRGVDESLNKEAIRVVSLMPNWIPGKQKGVNVNCKFYVPVNFRLE